MQSALPNRTQLKLLATQPSAYGGILLKARKGRLRGRPIDTKNTMHLVLRSSKATQKWSFALTKNQGRIKGIVRKFAHKYGVKILSMANVGNHLHFHVKLSNRFCYKPFIRAITSAIAMAVTGRNRWSNARHSKAERLKFWDYRPFTRVVLGYRAFLALKDYVKMNQMEGYGFKKSDVRFFLTSNQLMTVKIDQGCT